MMWKPLGGGRWLILAVLLGVAAYLYLNLFAFNQAAFLLSDDQVYFWMYAQRMLHGELPYRDFFQFTPLGTDLVYFGLFKLFGPRIWVTNLTVLALGVALCWVCFSIAAQVLERRLALLATLLFLTLIYSRLLNATHHWFSVLCVMCATAIAMRDRSSRGIAAAGALLGVASFFTQSHGPAAMLAFVILPMLEKGRTYESGRLLFWRHQGVLLAGFIITLLTLSAYFIAAVGLRQLWYFQITYVLRYVMHKPESNFLGMPEIETWRRLPLVGDCIFVYTLLPMIYPLVLRRCWRERLNRGIPYRAIALLSLVGLCLLTEVAFGLNWLRVYAVAMPGIILLIWVVGRTHRLRHYGLPLVWTGVLGIALLQTWYRHHHNSIGAELPGGSVATTRQAYEKLNWMMQHTSPGQFFFQAGWPGMYVPLQLRNPVFLDVVGTGDGTRPQYLAQAIRQLETKRVRYVLWPMRLDHPDNRKLPQADHLAPFRDYLRTKYQRLQVFSDQDEVWERSGT